MMAMVECPACDGTGAGPEVPSGGEGDVVEVNCPVCCGLGEVTELGRDNFLAEVALANEIAKEILSEERVK